MNVIVELPDGAGLNLHPVAGQQIRALHKDLSHQVSVTERDAPPLAVLLHSAGTALLIPVIDNAFCEELNKLAHICFPLSKYKEDADCGILSITWIVVLACQRTSNAIAGSACQGSPGVSQGGMPSEGFD